VRSATRRRPLSQRSLEELHRQYAAERTAELAEELVRRHDRLAWRAAAKFHRTGLPADDLTQVARVGLYKALTRFEPDRGTAFSTFAVTTMDGELKRYLRDYGWFVRPPRSVIDTYLEVERAADDLAQELGRRATIDEIAAQVRLSAARVAEAFQASRRRRAQPLETPSETADSTSERVSPVERSAASAWEPADIRDLVGRLPPLERKIVVLSYLHDWTLVDIAARLGLSAAQVSRLRARALTKLRSLAVERPAA
jgi:RNA polymerase sigma-B factor